VVPPTEPCALRSTQRLKVSIRDFSSGKDGRCVWLTTYHPCSAETSRKSGALNYPEPLGPPRPVAGHLYFTLLNLLMVFPIGRQEPKNATNCRNLPPKPAVFYVGCMEKTAESLTVLPQNDFGGCCEGWQAVGSGGNYFEGKEHVDAIILLMRIFSKLLALFCKHSL